MISTGLSSQGRTKHSCGPFFEAMTAPTQPIVDALTSGRTVEAEWLCREYLRQLPAEPDVWQLLAITLQQQNRLDEAADCYQQLTALQPDSTLHWGNYAIALRDAGRFDGAEQAFARAARLAPLDVNQLLTYGMLQMHRRDFPVARDTFFQAFEIDPDSPVVRIHAARACEICRDYRSEQLLQPWRSWLPLEDALQFELAGVQRQLGDNESARIVLEDLLNRAPAHLAANLLLIGIFERLNRKEDAKSFMQRTLAIYPDMGPAEHREIARVQAQLSLRDRDPKSALTLLQQAGPESEHDFIHYFNMAEVYDKLGDSGAAIQALKVAHERQIAELKIAVPYRFKANAPIFPVAAARVTKSNYRSWPQLRTPDAIHSPIFIVGFPRSGTTLLEQMLDAHPRLQSMDEQPFFNKLANQLDDYGVRIPEDLHNLDQRDCDELRKGYLSLACEKVPRSWNTQLVDKNPLNMLWLPMINRLFPQAKFILALRHPCDVLLSCYMLNFRASVLATACSTLEHLAQAYVTAMECWLYHVDVIEPDVFVSRYEDLVADAPGQTQRIANFLGLDDASRMLSFDARARAKGYIATPSYTQVIEPINTKGLNRWHRYREYFEPVVPILKPMLDHWRYSAD